ncbi:MAG: hypothetical protein WBL63_13470 [Candidatus Acidiferrum sp.]
MTFSWPRGLNLFLAVGLSALMAFPQGAIAQDHVVSSSDVKKDLQAATAARNEQLAQVEGFLATSDAKKALAEAHIDYQQVRTAVQSLSDEDLARVAAKADRAQKDFAAGTLSDRDLILIILGIAVLVLIIVAVR